MTLNWRNGEYFFKQRAFITSAETLNRNSNIFDWIFAFDTESALCSDGRYEPITFQLSGSIPFDSERLTYLEHRENALEKFLTTFDDLFGLYINEQGQKHVFMFAHNLSYDWLQLIKNYPDLVTMARTGIAPTEDYLMYDNGIYKAILLKGGLFRGNAPFFEIRIFHNKNVNYTIRFRDTFSFFPAALDKLGKELKLDECKKDRPEEIGTDYRLLNPRDPVRLDFETYAKIDAKVTRLVGERIRELHQSAGLQKIRVSAPSFAISTLIHGLTEGIKIVNGSGEESIMQLILNAYAGGRTGGIYHGRIDNVSVLDIHSSYPASMTTLPSFNGDMAYYEMGTDIPEADLLEVLDEYHAFLNIDGEELDTQYPALIKSEDGKLLPICGKFENISTTGIEVYVGIKSGTLKISKINQFIVLVDDPESVRPFKLFAEAAYTRKQNSEKGSPEYTSAKLVLNSSYGKLIESHSNMYIDEDNDNNIIVPFIDSMKKQCTDIYYSKYLEMIKDGKTDFFDYSEALLTEMMQLFTELGEPAEYATLNHLSLTELTFGRFAIPGAAALITGTSRARLLTAMKLLKALYWDTDSVFFTQEFDLEKINAKLAESKNLLPKFIQPLSIGENLGQLDAEIINAHGYLAGVKRYYLENDTDKKYALHGMPSVDKREAENLITKLAKGDNAKYLGRARPMKAKESKTADEIGTFKRKEYESIFELDERLEWTQTPGGWKGCVKPWGDMG